MSLIDVNGLFDGVFGLVGEFIEDKDKRNQVNLELEQLKGKLNLAVLNLKTHPIVDAIVKVMYALNIFWRPIGTAIMTGFGIYASITGLELSREIQLLLFGAFPGWGVSRHIEKNKGK